MKGPDGREMGEPQVEISIQPGSPMEVAQNRERLRLALERAYTELNGFPTQVEVLWEEGAAQPKTTAEACPHKSQA